MYGIMVGTINLIYYAPGKVTYHMACRYTRLGNPKNMWYIMHHMLGIVNVVCPVPGSLHAK